MFCFVDGPFMSSRVLLIYSCFVWVMCSWASFYVGKLTYNYTPAVFKVILFVLIGIQIYFVFWLVITRKSALHISNELNQLIQESSKLQLGFNECFTPFLPLAIILPMKQVLNYKYFKMLPPLIILDLFQTFTVIFTHGMIYTWILCCEKLYFNINNNIKLNSRRPTVNKLRFLMAQSLDIEALIYFISKSCGIPYLIMAVFTISIDIIYSSDSLYLVTPTSHQTGWKYLQDLMNFLSWNYSLYTMTCVCYRSHKLNIQVSLQGDLSLTVKN